MDGGRVAARGFQYQYLRTREAMLTASDQGRVHGCRIEGPVDSMSVAAIDVVDFDLVDSDGDCLLAAQVKSASPGRQVSAPGAFTILAELVCKVEAERYELITAALPDRNCRALVTLLNAPSDNPGQLRSQLAQLLQRASSATARLMTLSEQDLERLARARVIVDARNVEGIRRDLHERLRERRARHRAGLGSRSAGLITGHLVAEIMRRAADPHQAYWTIADFTDAALVEDDVLVRALGRQDWGSVFGPLAPVPDVPRPGLLAEIAEALTPADPRERSVNSCVLSGLSGIGKSSTAAAYVAAHADRYDLVLWADAATEEAMAGSFRRIWGHLNGHAHDSPAASTPYLREQVHELLAALPGRWLLVFDDATPADVDAWIPRLGRGDVLFTSIDSAGWQTIPCVGLSRMNHAQALELLTRRLRLNEKAAAEWREDLDALVETLEGWPLAIELACGYMRTCKIPVERLEHFRTLLLDRALADKSSKPSGYPQTLAATVELSLERLARNTADDGRELPNQVREVLGVLCNFAAQRIPVHLAMACAFIQPDIVPAGSEAVVLDEATVPVREIIRALIQVSFVRYDEPLASRFSELPGSNDTVSMNTVLQQLLRRLLSQCAQVDTALSRSAFHTARWLGAALDFGDGDLAWEIAPHAAALAGHVQGGGVKDNHTALLIGNLAGFEHIQGRMEQAMRLLHLELQWLQDLADPNTLLIAQTRISLAQMHAHHDSSDPVKQVASLLSPLVEYIERLPAEPDGEPAAALLATQALIVLRNLADTHPDDPRLRPILNAFTTLADQLPKTAAVTERLEAERVARLFGDGDLQGVEHAARSQLHRPHHSHAASFHAAEVIRHLVEALVYQRRWPEAEAEFETFLPYTGPRSLYRSSVQDFVHNVGLACALAWIESTDESAAALLRRVLTECSIEHLETALREHELARFTLLKAVDAAARQDADAFVALIVELRDQSFDASGIDAAAPWEQVFRTLLERVKAITSKQIHDHVHTTGEEVFDLERMLPEQSNYLRQTAEAALVDIHFTLSGQAPFQSVASIRDQHTDGDGTDGEQTRKMPIVLMEPRHMLTVMPLNGAPAMEYQVHRISGAGFRRILPEAMSIPALLKWRLVQRGNRIELRDEGGTVWARAQTNLPPRWQQAAATSKRVLVLYGFGFMLQEPAEHRPAFASPQAFAEHFHTAAGSGLLTAAFVEWDGVRPPRSARRQQGRKRRKR
ncbi:NB-ARC domain-containing protein [Streptomyces sp. NPDC007074]|uniref:NB-ARC domain-containing protein n=1 Tax=Streptomyces sp. NPDC007074 TaxID=3156764 RepID=UPI0033E37A9A